MAKNMFISTQNGIFSRLALLSSLLVLINLLLEAYARATSEPKALGIAFIQQYLPEVLGAIVLLLSNHAWQNRRKFGYKPLVACFFLILLASGDIFLKYNVTSFHESLHFLLQVCLLGLFWWARSMTEPHAYTMAVDNNNAFRLWAWCGLLLVFTQFSLNAWFNTLHSIHQVGMLLTISYLGILSVAMILQRQYCEMAFLMLFLLLTEAAFGILTMIGSSSLWTVLGVDIAATLILLTLISLLINLYSNPAEY